MRHQCSTWTGAQVGTLYTLNGVLVVLLQLPGHPHIKRLGPRPRLIVRLLGLRPRATRRWDWPGRTSACSPASPRSPWPRSSPRRRSRPPSATLAPPGPGGAYMGLFGLCQVAGQSRGPWSGPPCWRPSRPASRGSPWRFSGWRRRLATAVLVRVRQLAPPEPSGAGDARRDVSCSAPEPWGAPENPLLTFHRPATGSALESEPEPGGPAPPS